MLTINETKLSDALHSRLAEHGHHIYKLDGAWVSSDDAAVQAIIDAWVEPVPDLTPAQFTWLLAFTGLDDVWAGLEAALKSADRAAYATLRAQTAQTRFVYDVTVQMIAQFVSVASQIAPGVDLSEETIKAAWLQAAAATP